MWVLEPTNEEFTGECNIDVYIAVHGVFAQKVDAELFAGLGKAPHAVKGENVGEDAPTAVVVHQVKKLEGHFL